jgi:hypothetical protein
MTRRTLVLALAVLAPATLWIDGTARAQDTTSGLIEGRVLDARGAGVPGASVTLSAGQGTRVLRSDARGHFLAPYLTPDVYTVRVELPGFTPVEQRDVRLRLGQRLELSFALALVARHEAIEVTAASSVIDSASTTAGGVLDGDELARLPVPRRFTSTLYMVPGVSDSSGLGEASPSIAGASGLENHYLVDGVNITNPAFGSMGVYGLSFGSLGHGVTTDFVQETEVKTAGFEAEYGQATGGVVNAITRSGTNSFRGSVFGFWRPPGLEGRWPQQRTDLGRVNTTRTEELDFGVNAGGAVVKDRLFYFAAFNPLYDTRTLVAPDGFPLESLGQLDRKRRTLSYAGKITWQAASGHRVDLSAFGDPSHGPAGPQRPRALLAQDAAQFSEIESYGGHNQALRYSGILRSDWLVEATAGHASTGLAERPMIDEWRVADRTAVPFVVSGGLGGHQSGTRGDSLQLSFRSTHLFSAGGSHELRWGVQRDGIEYTRGGAQTGPAFTFPDGRPTRTGATVDVLPDPVFGRIYRVAGLIGDSPTSTQEYWSWFVQDTWRAGRRLTLRPGLRWERQRLEGGGTPLCYSDESLVGKGDGTPGNEIPCAYTWSDNWGPRLGAVFDVTASGRSRIYASWGRYYARIPNDLADAAMSGEAGARADYFNSSLTEPVPEGVLAARTRSHFLAFGGSPATFANGSRSTYHDELLAGFEIEAIPSLSLGIRYVHRSLPSVLEDYATAPLVAISLGLVAPSAVEYVIGNIRADIPTLDTSGSGVPHAFFEDPVHNYDALELTAQKALSKGWSLLASYRWSRLRGNFEGFYRSENPRPLPAVTTLTTLFDFPTNDPSYSEIGVRQLGYRGDIRYQGSTLGVGRLPNDRPHQLKIYGTYAWRGLTTGLSFRAGSGAPLTALAANPLYGNPGEIPETVRGAGIETVSGFRRRAPTAVLLDLHLDYTVRLAGTRRLIFSGNVFNVLNSRDPITYDTWSEVQSGLPNPDFGKPAKFGGSQEDAFETPRQVRLGTRFEW